jgi:hypothetical protein
MVMRKCRVGVVRGGPVIVVALVPVLRCRVGVIRGGPVIVVALVPVSRCGVVSNKVAGWGAFDVLTLSLLPRLHGVP